MVELNERLRLAGMIPAGAAAGKNGKSATTPNKQANIF